jgi:hypothetical protein
MKSKNSNAVLINVDGRSNDGGVALPINGKCHVWKYVYASQPDDLVYDVIVRDGKLESVKTRKLSQTSVEKILYSYGDPTIASWNADSADAASISRDELKKLTGLDSPAWAIYALELSCWGKLTWTVYNFDANSRVIADIGIDEERGILANSWLAPTVTPGTVETPRPTRVPDTRGEESSAKDWLPLADDAMEQEDSNAVLIYVHGYSSDHGTVLPVNGMSHEWWYQYAVPGQNTVYDIYVHDGEVRSLEEGTTKNGNVPIGNWAMDSVDAVTVAGAKFKEMTGNDPLSVAYVLEGSFVPAVKGKPTWNVCYYDAKTKVIANIQVSLETGAVVYTWMPPA